MPRPVPSCTPPELKALIAPAIGLTLEDFAGMALCVVTVDDDGAPVVDVISDGASWRQTALTLAYAQQSVLTPGR